MIHNTQLRLKKKIANFAEYFHPRYLAALVGGAAPQDLRAIRQSLRYRRPTPPCDDTKRGIIRDYATRSGCRIFVETGTFRGDTLAAVADLFDELHSIEIDPTLHRCAVERFQGDSKFRIHLGDSGRVISEIIKQYDEPILFWLDGHASGGETGTGTKSTPIIAELAAISRHKTKSHVVLIDDAMDFGVELDYPTLDKLKKSAPDYPNFTVDQHIIRITSQHL